MAKLGQSRYQYGDIRERVAREASEQSAQQQLEGYKPQKLKPMSLPGAIAGSIGGGILSAIPGYSAYKANQYERAGEAAMEGGEYTMEDGDLTLTDVDTGEAIDVSTLDPTANKDLLDILAAQNTMTTNQLHEHGLVKIVDDNGNIMNAKSITQDITLADGSTKTINVNTFHNANEYISDPAKRTALVMHNVRRNLEDARVGDSMANRVVAEIERAIANQRENSNLQNVINSNKIKLLDQENFSVIMSNLSANEIAKQKAKIQTHQTNADHIKTHNEVYNKTDNQDLINTSFNVDGQKGALTINSQFVTGESLGRIGPKLDSAVNDNLNKAGLTTTGRGAELFYSTNNQDYVGKQGQYGKGVDTIVSQADYGAVFTAGEDANIRDLGPTDFSDANWRKNANSQRKLELLTKLGIINKNLAEFSNVEEEMEYDAYALTYFDRYFSPQYNNAMKSFEAINPRARQQFNEIRGADDKLRRVLVTKRYQAQQFRDLSNSGTGKMLLDRQNQLIESGNFLTGKVPDEGMGLAGEVVDLNSDSIESNLRKMDNIQDRMKYIDMLSSNGFITEEAAEFLTDKERYIYANTNKLETEIVELESQLKLSSGGGRYAVSEAKKEVDDKRYGLLPVSPKMQFRISGLNYNAGTGKFEAGDVAINYQNMTISTDAQGSIQRSSNNLVNQANFFNRLDNNFKQIRTKHTDVSAEQYLDVVRKRFEEQDKEEVMKTFKLDEDTYTVIKNSLEQLSDDDLLEFFVDIQEAKQVKAEETSPLPVSIYNPRFTDITD